MSELTLRAFRVRNFQNVDDSGWISVDRVTALVGRNEAGKTTLLKALYRLNPATAEPYDPMREFPRERFIRDFVDPADWPVASARFEISPTLRAELAKIAHPLKAPGFVVATRHYDQRLVLDFEPVEGEPETPAAAVLAAFDALAGTVVATPDIMKKNAAPEGTKKAMDPAEKMRHWITLARQALGDHGDLASPEARPTLERLASETTGLIKPDSQASLRADVQPAVEALHKAIVELLNPLPAGAPDLATLAQAIEPKLPIFIYFDKDAVLDSALYLPRLADALEHRPEEMGLRTVNAIFRHAGLTVQEILDLGVSESRERRQRGEVPPPEVIRRDQSRAALRAIKLGSASAEITRRFGEWWKQAPVAIRYHADGDFFRIWISDGRAPAVEIELENRSQGFQWFFSFYLLFLTESDSMKKDAVLLLDCPGMHLHPSAQRELLNLFNRLAETAPLVYSTHSPFLIDGNHLDRLRMVGRDEAGHFQVSNGLWPADHDTLYPVHAAAGYALMKSLIGARRHLLVGEFSDFLYLQTLNLLCRKSKRTALAESIQLTPCGGASLAAGFASLFMAENLRPAVLLGGDDAGRAAREILHNALHVSQEGSAPTGTGSETILLMDEALGKPGTGAGIEDLIGELRVLGVLEKILSQHLPLIPGDRVSGGLVNHIRVAAARLAVVLPPDWKTEVARQTAIEWAMKEAEAVPAEVLDAAASLFADINARQGAGAHTPARSGGPQALRLVATAPAGGGGSADKRYDPKLAARIALSRGTD